MPFSRRRKPPAEPRDCRNCGRVIPPERGHRFRYCSEDCRRRARAARDDTAARRRRTSFMFGDDGADNMDSEGVYV